MAKVKDIFNCINELAPFDTQFQWDNAGLIIGDMNGSVNKIGVALDATDKVIEKAVSQGCDLLVTHHPIIFNAVKAISFTSPYGLALKNSLAVISAHTNLDVAKEGVNFALANKIKLEDVKNISSGETILWVGKIKKQSPKEFAEYISEKLDTCVSYADGSKKIETVAVCGGAAGEYLYDAAKAGIDAFVTGEVHHHEYLDAKRIGISVFCAGHFETENPVVPLLAEKIREKAGVEAVIIKQERPVKYTGRQKG